VTPIPSSIAQPLIDGLKNEVIVTNNHAQKIFPSIRPRSYEDAVRLALARLQDGKIENSWSDAVSNTQVQGTPVMLTTQEGMIRERRQLLVKASPEALYQTITSLGGQKGWLYMNWAWRFRGLLDTLLGGVGMRSGRRDPNRLRTGDTVDFWRVEAIKPNELLRLRAEMKVPGNAWLQFEISPNKNNSNTLIQTAFFAPKGLFGILYWYLLYPIHCLIFSGLIRKIAQQGE
jgi:hypothetical protein